MKHLKWIVVFLVVLGAGLFFLSQIGSFLISEVTQELKVEVREESEAAFAGKPAPYFELRNLSGESVKITDFLESPTILTFWTTWNQNSVDQLKILDDYVRMKGESLFKVIAINSQEDRSVVSSFILRGGYGLTVLLDEDGAVTEKYGSRSLPATFFMDKGGFIKNMFIGIIDVSGILNKVETILK